MNHHKRFFLSGLAMVNMLIFVIMFTVLSGIMMTVVSSSSRLLEQHVRRKKAYYPTEAAVIYAIDAARRGGWAGSYVIRPTPQNVNVPWSFDPSGNPLTVKTATVLSSATATGPSTTFQVNGSVNYQLNW